MPRKRYPTTKPALPVVTRPDRPAAKRTAATEMTPPPSTSAHPPEDASTRYSVIPAAPSQAPAPSTLVRLETYLAALPNGLGSYPEAKVKGATVLAILTDPQCALPLGGALPAVIERLVRTPPGEDDWVPVVHMCAIHAIIHDCVFAGDEGSAAYEEAAYARNLRLLRSPQYEGIVAVQNPELLLRAYHARWSAFYRGCPLDVMEGSKGHLVLRLSYPPHCWPELSRLTLAAAFRAGLVVSGGKAPQVTTKALSPRAALFDVRWR